jgi:hypothetical protein
MSKQPLKVLGISDCLIKTQKNSNHWPKATTDASSKEKSVYCKQDSSQTVHLFSLCSQMNQIENKLYMKLKKDDILKTSLKVRKQTPISTTLLKKIKDLLDIQIQSLNNFTRRCSIIPNIIQQQIFNTLSSQTIKRETIIKLTRPEEGFHNSLKSRI